MVIDFNPAKDAINQVKHHGLSLALAREFDWAGRPIVAARTVGGEARWKMVAEWQGTVYAVIFTRRPDVFWIISLRPASRKERRSYEG